MPLTRYGATAVPLSVTTCGLPAAGDHSRPAHGAGKIRRKSLAQIRFRRRLQSLSNWYNADVLGIDAGITLLMAENVRTGFVWEQFMKNDEARRGMQIAGFQDEGKETPAPPSSPGAGFPFWPG